MGMACAHMRLVGMTKTPEPDGYTRNPKLLGRVYPIPDEYWVVYGYGKNIFRGCGTDIGLDDTRNYILVYLKCIPETF
ncbi:hypothetical protein Hanom_Chr16g01502771 [Helianthus anomalus]